MDDIIAGYASAAAALIGPYEAIVPEKLYAPVIDLFPRSPGRIVDIGSATGRDAAWLAAKGHDVLAVEPVDMLREAAMRLHVSPRIEWLADRLPDLRETRRRGTFGIVLLSGVWQHVADHDRPHAIDSLTQLVAPGGVLIMSLRHGPGAMGRPVYPIDPAATIASASLAGLALIRRTDAASIQSDNRRRGVRWTWVAFTKR